MNTRTQYAILITHALLIAWWVGFWISMDFWTSWLTAFLVAATTGVPLLTTYFLGIWLSVRSDRPRRILLHACLSLLAAVSLAWSWIRLDDWTFDREALRYESGHSRPRWFPYQSVDLEQDEAGDPVVYD